MAVMALTMAAMASVMTSVSMGWKQQGTTQVTYLANRQVVSRVQQLIQSAKLIGLVREGSLASNTTSAACAVLWRCDNSGGNADRAIQFSEIGLLIHDRATNSLKYYTVKFPSSLTPAQITAADSAVYHYSDLTSSSAPENFMGLNYVTAQTVAKNVTGAAFYANQPLGQSSQFPTFEFQLAFTRNGNVSQVYGSTALRNPDFKPTP
ncbi:MAG TPA: hypothetical protein VFE58_17005 [Tepidisphaeraceae bacterium]|nr:hypothetical protein [Tepidisphaeraceae bacterium]